MLIGDTLNMRLCRVFNRRCEEEFMVNNIINFWHRYGE